MPQIIKQIEHLNCNMENLLISISYINVNLHVSLNQFINKTIQKHGRKSEGVKKYVYLLT